MRRERLHREGQVHDLDGVAVGARDVDETALDEEIGAQAAGKLVPRDPRPDLLARPEQLDVDLAVVVACVRQDDAVLQVRERVPADRLDPAGGR